MLQLRCLYAAGWLARRFRFRGIPKLAYLLGTRVFDPRNSVVVALDGLGKLRVPLRDGYWTNLLFSGFDYEPEVKLVLSAALTHPASFVLDCGANIGYWSIVASRAIDRRGRVLAIEASPAIFDRLLDNAALNDNRFDCLPAAIWSQDGEVLSIVSHDERHAGSSVVSRRDKQREQGYWVDEVRSATLDTICERHVPDDAEIVIKLDVEGAEIDALRGAEKLLANRYPLLVYEDHGNDPACAVSQFILRELDMDIYYCTVQSTLIRMPTLAAIQEVKKDPTRGYNFFACSSVSVFARSLARLTS